MEAGCPGEMAEFFDDLIRVHQIHSDAVWWATLDSWRDFATTEQEIENLLKAVDVAYQSERWQQVHDLAINMVHLLWYKGRPDDREDVMQRGLDATDRLIEIYHGSPAMVHRLMLDQAWMHGDGFGWLSVIQQKRELGE